MPPPNHNKSWLGGGTFASKKRLLYRLYLANKEMNRQGFNY
jgi:hypothetical protein